MPLRRSAPLRYPARTVSDTLDATQTDAGAMQALSNLVPEQSTPNVWVPRPAAAQLTNFAGFTTPGFISCMLIQGTVAYGMIASGLNAGKDQPFAYDLVGGGFITISGITAANCPTSPATTGAWTPPTMCVVGTRIVITHPGFDGTSHFVGFLNIANPAAPAWTSSNTTGTALPSVPVAAAQFNGRAWYLCNPAGAQPAAYFTDVLDPTKITNATQILTFDDNTPLTAAAGLPLESTSQGGVVQSLMVFKGLSNIYQVTGDQSTSNLAKNTLNVPTGTLSPLSVVPTPKGLAFVDHDGLRMIDWNGRVSDPIGANGKGVNVPLIYAGTPSRTVCACNASVIRISVQNGFKTGSPWEEYWYDMVRDSWSGPHTFPASMIAPYSNTFIVAPYNVSAKLFQSDIYPTVPTANYTENGVALQWEFTTSFFPDTGQMAECAMIETTINASFAAGSAGYTVQALDDMGAVQGFANLAPSGSSSLSQWGSMIWGTSVWGGISSSYSVRRIAWSAPVVFRRLQIKVTGASGAGVKLGDFNMRYQILGYLQQ